MSALPLKTVGAYALVLVGVAALVVLSALSIHPSRAGATARSIADTKNLEISAGSCAVQPVSSVPAVTLRQGQTEARALLDGGNTGEAISRLRSLVAADPGLPGIHLDLSTALLKGRQTEAAKAAISTQLNASECLSRLPSDALDAYCKRQMSQSTASGCRQELAAIERSAHFQSALVQMELANSVSGINASGLGHSGLGHSSLSLPQRSEAKPTPKLLASTRTQGTTGKPKPAAGSARGGNPLAAGAGTDAALGAYSK